MKGFEKLRDIQDRIAELRYELNDKARGAFAEGFAIFFKDNPEIEDIHWRQYTPYFNDGDACEFGVCDIYFKLKGTEEEGGDYDDGRVTPWCYVYEDKSREGDRLHLAMQSMSKFLESSEEALEDAFGDHVEVTVTRDEIRVDEYYHD
jgi:hypothetical protein